MKYGPYEVVAKLGQGAMGVVLHARDERGVDVALKLLHRPDAKQARDRFAREERLQELLSAESGFVPLLASGESPEGPWFAMPLLAGGTLRDRLAAGPLGGEAGTRLVATLAEAMGRAHERGVVHRDLKPENVLFDGTGDDARPLIADLGLAKHFLRDAPGASASVSLSRSGTFRGTPGYMAPEQVMDARSCGPPADVFALGAILHECIAGQPPFVGESIVELLAAVRNEERPRLEPGAAPPWIAEAVSRCLALDAGERFADGAALAAALRATPRTTRSKRPLAIGLFSLVLVALAGGGVFAWSRVKSRPKSGVDPRDSERAVRLAKEALETPDTHGAAREQADEAFRLDPTLAITWTARGRARRLRGDHDGGLADLDEAIRREPALAAAWTQRAVVRLARKEPKLAVVDATKAIELDPSFAYAWRTLALARHQLGEKDTALAAIDKAVELDPRLASAWGGRATIHTARGELELAIKDATRAIELDPLEHYSWGARAWARFILRDDDGAIADATRAIELARWNPEYWSTRARCRAQKGSYADAIADYGKVIEISPSAMDLRSRGLLRQRTQDLEGAIADLTSACALSPNSALFAGELAAACWVANRREEAVRHVTRAIELDPKRGNLINQRGLHFMHLGRVKDALADFERATELDPKNAMNWANVAAAHCYLDQWKPALDAATHSLELDPKSYNAWVWSGWAHFELGELEAAISDLERGLRINTESKEAWRNLGRARLARGELDAAVTAFTKRIALTPQEGRCYADRAGALATKGDLREALADLDRALQLGLPDDQANAARRRRDEIAAQLR